MNAHCIRTVALASLVLLLAARSEEPAGRLPVWPILEKLLAQENALPHRPEAGDDLPHPPERTFLFDEVLALEPAALLRGAAYVAVRNPAPASADAAVLAAHARRVDEELQTVLEYYPLIAKTRDDFTLLTDAIASGKQPPALRRFLLRNCVPAEAQPSSLGRYLMDHLADGAPALQDALMALIQNPTEDRGLQEVAVGVLGTLIPVSFDWIIAHDEEAAAHAEKTGKPVEVRAVLDAPGTIPLAKASAVRLEQQRQRAGTLAAILGGLAGDDSHSTALRKIAGETAARLHQSYPLPLPQDVLPPPPPIPQPPEN